MDAGPHVQFAPSQIFARPAPSVGLTAQATQRVDMELNLECDEDLDEFSREAEGQCRVRGTGEESEFDEMYREEGRENTLRGVDRETWESLQQRISPLKYSILLDWLCEVSSDHSLSRETFHLALSFVSRFLIKNSLPANELQLLAVSALSLAAKAEEETVPRLAQLSQSCSGAFDATQIKSMEQRILSALDWKLLRVTPASLLLWLMTRWDTFVSSSGHYDVMFMQWDKDATLNFTMSFWVLDACWMSVGALTRDTMECTAAIFYLAVCYACQRNDYAMVRGALPGDASQLTLCSAVEDLFSRFLMKTCGIDIKRLYTELDFLVPFFNLLAAWEMQTGFDELAGDQERRMWALRQRHYEFTLQALAALVKSS